MANILAKAVTADLTAAENPINLPGRKNTRNLPLRVIPRSLS